MSSNRTCPEAERLREFLLARKPAAEVRRAADSLCRKALERTDSETCILRVLDGPDGVVAGAAGRLPSPLKDRMTWNQGLARTLVAERTPVRVVDVRADERTMHLWQAALEDPNEWYFLSFAGIPLIEPEGAVTGYAGVYTRTCVRAFMPEDIALLQEMFSPVADVLPLARHAP